LAVTSDGRLLISNRGSNQVLARAPDGTVQVFAGTGVTGSAGDGGLATQAQLNGPQGIAVARDGTVYIADSANGRVRAVSPTGVISTVAVIPNPQSLAIDPLGRVLVAAGAVLRIDGEGTVETVLAGGVGRYIVDGQPSEFDADAIAVEGDGTLVVASFATKYIARIAPDGTLLGAWHDYINAGGLAVGPDGSVYAASYSAWAVERVTATGPVPVSKFERGSIPAIDGAFRPDSIAVEANGTIYVSTDGGGGTNVQAVVAIDPGDNVSALAADPTR
jgi:serine/threonine-protein kinase